MATIVFTNQKGGPGKTTLAVLFAFWLAERHGQRVAVIDLDSQCNASKTLAAHDSGVSSVALFGAAQTAPRTPAACGAGALSLFGGSRTLVDIERGRPEVVIPALRQQMAWLEQRFDTCVVDTPPALGLRMSAALIAADWVVCPIELEEYSIDGVSEMLKTVFGVRQRYNPCLRLAGLVANRFNPHSVRQKEALAALLDRHRRFVIPARISTRSAIPEALAEGLPVWRLPKSSARTAAAEVERVFALLQQRMCEGVDGAGGAGSAGDEATGDADGVAVNTAANDVATDMAGRAVAETEPGAKHANVAEHSP